jgi:hypothetical protein
MAPSHGKPLLAQSSCRPIRLDPAQCCTGSRLLGAAVWRFDPFRLNPAQRVQSRFLRFGDPAHSGSIVLKALIFSAHPLPLVSPRCRPVEQLRPRPKARDRNRMNSSHPMCHGRLVRHIPSNSTTTKPPENTGPFPEKSQKNLSRGTLRTGRFRGRGNSDRC